MKKGILLLLCLMCSISVQAAKLEVKDIIVKPRWPWNGMVDVTYTVVCDKTDEKGEPVPVYVDFTAIDGDRRLDGQEATVRMKSLTGDGAKEPVTGDGNGKTYTVTWDMAKDSPNFHSSDLKVRINAMDGMGQYLVIYLDKLDKEGEKKYDFKSTMSEDDLAQDACRTTELWLRKVEAGTFTMGSNDGGSDERPPHEVTLTEDYYIGVFECTKAQWDYVMGNGGSSPYPKAYVSYNKIRGSIANKGAGWPEYGHAVDDDSFMGRLRAKVNHEKLLFDLPTEAQWEFAARGGNASKGYTYSGSDDVDAVAWYYYNAKYKSHIVGTKAKNELGLYDMSGNLWEWCLDWYGNYQANAVADPPGVSTGSRRVMRGGCWSDVANYCRLALRVSYAPARDYIDYSGFRVVCLPLAR